MSLSRGAVGRMNGKKGGTLRLGVGVAVAAALAASALVGAGLAVDEQARAAYSGANGEILLDDGRDVLAVREDGSGLRNLTAQGPGVEALDEHGAVSPDGLRVAFFSNRDQLPMDPREVPQAWLYVMNADGSGARKVVDGPLQATHAPAWSPDGRELALADNRGISVVDVASGGVRPVASGEVLASDAPSWSPDGTTIAYAAYGGTGGVVDVFAARSDGSGEPKNLTEDSPAIDRAPAWVPSEDRIAYVSYAKGTGFPDNDLVVRSMGADGSDKSAFPQAVGEELRQVESWAFSPDGKRISYSTGSEAGVRAMDADGTGAGRVADAPAVSDWGPAPADVPAPAPAPNAKPAITNPRPAPASTIRDRTPRISATVRDKETDLAKADVRAYLDGRRIPGRVVSYDRAANRLTFSPSAPLARGRHAVKVAATDERGAEGSRRWVFRVR